MNGSERFEFYLSKVQELLDKSKTEPNPGWWLFTNGFRTPMFMLEALAKLYNKLHDKDTFEKLQDKFKQLEDVLGDIDYYNAYGEEYKNMAEVSPQAIEHFREKKEEHLQLLNDVLVEEKWIGSGENRVEKIRANLKDLDWLSEKEEMFAIRKFYVKAIESIKEFYASLNGAFTDMESQVHEIRRKLRWLSIYPQALQGCIQLKEQALAESHVEKYLIPEIVNSPFNKIPAPSNNEYILYLEKNYFLSLSWLIAELGKLKDAGLGLIAIAEASKHNRDNKQPRLETAPQLTGMPSVQDSMNNASEISKTFFAEGNLDKLVGEVEKRP